MLLLKQMIMHVCTVEVPDFVTWGNDTYVTRPMMETSVFPSFKSLIAMTG